MNYLESVVYIESLSPATQVPCLERIALFMEELGRLQDRFWSIHIGGTNGKGSTVAMLDSILRCGGLKVGRFTGPHLLRWNERFHVDGQPISDERFAGLASSLRVLSEEFGRRHNDFGPLTWFELLTAMAFTYFAEERIDVAVLEVGLGGRWDATNIVAAPLATAITNVDLDHTQILGETTAAIAREKAGIIKAHSPVVTAATGDALEEIILAARDCSAPTYVCEPPQAISLLSADSSCQLSLTLPALPELLECRHNLSLAGEHQQLNALVAAGVMVASGLAEHISRRCCYYSAGVSKQPRIKDVVLPGRQPDCWLGAPASAPAPGAPNERVGVNEPHQGMNHDAVAGTSLLQLMTEAVSTVYWPGRMQLIEGSHLLIDGAHNPAGARALRRSLDTLLRERQFVFVIGCFENKDVPAYLSELVRPGDRVIACEASSRRTVFSAERIVESASACGADAISGGSVEQALVHAIEQRKSNDLIVATGSFATVREVMLAQGWQKVEDGLSCTRMNWLPTTCQGSKSS